MDSRLAGHPTNEQPRRNPPAQPLQGLATASGLPAPPTPSFSQQTMTNSSLKAFTNGAESDVSGRLAFQVRSAFQVRAESLQSVQKPRTSWALSRLSPHCKLLSGLQSSFSFVAYYVRILSFAWVPALGDFSRRGWSFKGGRSKYFA